MLKVEFTVSVLNLIILIFGALFTGYLIRSRQVKKKQHKISDLRKEIVRNHAEILELQMEYVALEKSMSMSKATVLPMNAVPLDIKESAAR